MAGGLLVTVVIGVMRVIGGKWQAGACCMV